MISGCGSTEIVTEPVIVEVPVTKFVPVPAEHLAEQLPSTIPEKPTYGEIISLFAQDRAAIQTLNAQLRAIRELTVE